MHRGESWRGLPVCRELVWGVGRGNSGEVDDLGFRNRSVYASGAGYG